MGGGTFEELVSLSVGLLLSVWLLLSFDTLALDDFLSYSKEWLLGN